MFRTNRALSLLWFAMMLAGTLWLLIGMEPRAIAQTTVLFVSSQNAVLRYDALTGVPLPAPGQTGATFVVNGSGGLSIATGVTVGPDGNLYVSSRDSNQVLQYDGTTGAFLSQFVTAGSGGLVKPYDLTFGPDGNLYVVYGDSSGGVNRYDGTTGAFIDNFIAPGSAGPIIPRGLIFPGDGNLYLSNIPQCDGAGGSVLQFDGTSGAFLGTFATGGGLDRPHMLSFGPDGNLYVASYTNGAVMRYDGTTGNPFPADGQSGAVFVPSGAAGLSLAVGLVFDPNGNLLVSSMGSNKVLRFDGNSGSFIDSTSSSDMVQPVWMTLGTL